MVDEQFGEPEVALTRPDRATHTVGNVRRHRGQDHARVLPMKPADDPRKRIGGKRIENRDRQRAGPQFGDVVHDGPRPLHIGENLPRRVLNDVPAGVIRSFRPPRSNSSTPRSRSRVRIACDSDGCAMNSARAASVMLP